MRASRPTLKHVAEQAGVSIATASIVIRGLPNARVGKHTRRRVLSAAQKLKYHRNALASGLRRGKTDVVAFLVNQLATPTLATKVAAAQKVLQTGGLRTVFWFTSQRPEVEERALADIRSHMVNGLIVGYAVGERAASLLGQFADEGVPLVLLEPSDGVVAHVVTINREAVVRTGTRHLLGLGHTRVALVGSERFVDLANGWGRAYVDTLKQFGVAVDRRLVRKVATTHTFQTGYDVAVALLSMPAPPTGMVCSDDEVAIGAMRACREKGIRVPEGLAIVGFDDLPVAEFAAVPLTTIGHPAEEAGRLAAQRILKDMDAGEPSPARTVILEPELIVRESCGARLKKALEHRTCTSTG